MHWTDDEHTYSSIGSSLSLTIILLFLFTISNLKFGKKTYPSKKYIFISKGKNILK